LKDHTLLIYGDAQSVTNSFHENVLNIGTT